MNSEVTQKLEAVMSELHRDSEPGAIVSVKRRGKILLRRGYGLASIDCGRINTPSTKMRIGSTTKHFASALALMLRDEGVLSIDEPVSRWLPELPTSQGSRTLRQFMTHTGGTRDYLDLSLISNGMAMLPDEAAFDFQCRQRGQNFAPGDGYIYNNGGYRMLSMVIERVLGTTLAEAFRERLFEPLSMHDTTLWATDLDPLPGIAQTYTPRAGGGFAKGIFPATILGEGGVASTLDDMQRWLSHLVSPSLWPQSLSDELMAPTTLANGYVNAYGMGLIAETWRGVRVIHHAGGVVGGNCQMLAAPDHDIQIVAMTNRADVSAPDLTDKILAVLLEDVLTPPAKPADPNQVEQLGGDYYCAESGRYFSIVRMGDALLLKNFGMPLPLTSRDSGSLWVNMLSVIVLEVVPVHGDNGDVVAIEVVEQGRRFRCRRVEPEEKKAVPLHRFAGRWHSDELAATVVIDGEKTDSIQISGLYGHCKYKLEPLAEDACVLLSTDPSIPMDGTLRLASAADGTRRLILDTGRTRGLELHEAAP